MDCYSHFSFTLVSAAVIPLIMMNEREAQKAFEKQEKNLFSQEKILIKLVSPNYFQRKYLIIGIVKKPQNLHVCSK